MIGVIFTLLFSGHCFAKTHTNALPLSDSVLITADSIGSVQKILNNLPPKTQIIDQYENYLIVKISFRDKETFDRVARMTGVLQINHSLSVHYRSGLTCTDTSQTALQSSLKNEMACRAMQTCNPSGRTRLWAQEAIASDLAQKYLSENKIPRVTKVAVVDSGFNGSLIDQINARDFQVHPGLTSVIHPDQDSVGHGSRVVSLIKGQNGIGASADSPLAVYSLGKGDNISTAELGTALLRACNAGNQVINVSIGSDGLGLFQIALSDQLPKSILSKLRKQGCILVHAAGNDGGFVSSSSGQALEPQVIAANSNGSNANFSSAGNFRAPGEGVIGLGTGSEQHGDPADECNDTNQNFASGTSFAAPLYTANLALVRDMLMTSSSFQKLSKIGQAELLSQISQSSSVDGLVNSYLGVRIAEEWAKHPGFTVDQAKNQLTKDQVLECQKPSIRCNSQEINCVQNQMCEDQARERGLLCQSKSATQILTLVHDLENRGDLEGASYWRRVYATQNPNGKIDGAFPFEVMKSELEKNASQAVVSKWVNYYANWQMTTTVDSTEARTYLQPAASRALLNSNELLGREENLTSHNDATQLFIGMKKADLYPPELTDALINSLRRSPKLSIFYIDDLLTGQREGVVSKAELAAVLQKLTGANATVDDLTNAATLLANSRSLKDSDKLIYVNNILRSSLVSDDMLKNVSTTGETDKPSELWLKFALDISRNDHAGVQTANSIVTALFVGKDEGFPPGSTGLVSEILKNLSPKFGTGEQNPIQFEMIREINQSLK